MSITYTKLSGVDVVKIMEKIEEVVIGERKDAIGMACLSFALLLQNPNLEAERVAAGVKGASEWMACFVADVDESKVC